MKLLRWLFAITFGLQILTAIPVLAADAANDYGLGTAAAGAGIIKNKEDATKGGAGLAELSGRVIRAALTIIGVVFLLLMVYGGFIWMIARGDKEKVKEGRDTIVNATIGLVLVLAAYAITQFIFTSFVANVVSGGPAAP
ncbi:MAG: hypothetical protein HW383_289 [Candidatus Magasanikbacteria bacterium]|nr:hypothetical protein [Candidatus Magasanikbacteria bacterium]